MTSHIVVVDDEPITLKQLRRILEKEGHRVSAFSSPRRALDHIERNPCDVLISDVRMPAMDGMELVARAIHAASRRSAGPFLAFNCGALSETLIDNELFGHEKGAFTGAESRGIGLVEAASGGTLFLDEIGEMPTAMQVKLLRVLQEGELMRVGGSRPVPVDVRIVSATAADIKAAVGEGTFRKDLYFRINVVNIKLPGLAERREDIPLLAYHILSRLNRQGGKNIQAISEKAMALLSGYAFPGNVRELENILERAVAVCQGELIRECDLPPDLVALELQAYRPPDETFMTLAELERDYMAHLLKITGGARSRTAEILGIDRASLWRKMKKYDLE